jgi:CheY-like chemotaxis protein
MKLDVLVVDDCRDIRETLAAILQRQGLEVALAENGQAALALLARGAEPGLIILDLRMPVMDGWAFLEACRDRPVRLKRTVVASSLARPGELARIRADYGCRTMDKPFDIEALIRIAHEACSKLAA